ncbi:hypothetical protein CyaNS01_00947 [Cyanobium sp. NS01]|nr:hypothetical protein CyaNS01_00947 [Cyanobium sp. NS01]
MFYHLVDGGGGRGTEGRPIGLGSPFSSCKLVNSIRWCKFKKS